MAHDHRLEVLRVLGYDLQDEASLEEAVFQLDARHWMQLSKSLNITDQISPALTLYCAESDLNEQLSWALVIDQGEPVTSFVCPGELKETGEYYIDSVRYSARELALGELALGYHKVSLHLGSHNAQTTVAVCPSKCFELTDSANLWGITCQLYTLRSNKNWGIGDFGDLKDLIVAAANCGADLIGLNPLHGPMSGDSNTPSPYSPSDRRVLNPLYIDLKSVPEYSDAASIQSMLDRDSFNAELAALRESAMVDYHRVSLVKYAAFELLYEQFLQSTGNDASSNALDFEAFIVSQGESLKQYCLYEVKHNSYAQRYKDDLGFYQYLQWLANNQLLECQTLALESDMSLGLVGDLAVGAVAQGSEVQSNIDCFLTDVTIGAPPDPFSESGQNWGLPVPRPVAMRRQDFKHYISLLRANMRHVGALRIDHVMSLMRLWWCLPGDGKVSRDGIYVYYPFDELMALLRLESQLNCCAVIGEDLGVVPVEVRLAMSDGGLYSNKIFYFEQELDGRFKKLSSFERDAMLMVSNHDVPSLSEWWNKKDLVRRKELGLLTGDSYVGENSRRDSDKAHLLEWLTVNNVAAESWRERDIDSEFDFALCKSIHQACAKSNARMMMIQLEDLQQDIAPVNIPGTHLEYPNWRRKQTAACQQILAADHAQSIIDAIVTERIH